MFNLLKFNRMKRKFYILIVSMSFLFSSCEVKEWFFDVKTTDSVSSVSVKPLMILVGEPIISLQEGGTYVEEGVLASEVSLGENDLQTSTIIESGNVDVNVKDFYTVTYKSENTFNWVSYVYRSVLVHDGTPYSEEIGYDDFYFGFEFDAVVTKHSINGYWTITSNNLLQEPGTDEELTIIFADKEGGNYGIVSGVHPTKGRYFGTAIRIYKDLPHGIKEDGLKFTITFISNDGVSVDKNYIWYCKSL
jgi:hypothetical protein